MTQSTETKLNNGSNSKWGRLTIKIPNTSNDSQRVVVVPPSSSVNSKVVSTKFTSPTPVNVVEPLPVMVVTQKVKPQTSTTVPMPNLQNLPIGKSTPMSANVALRRQMIFLFKRPCFSYLNGRDCLVDCKWNHNLPPVREIYEKMMLFTNDTIMYMYTNFILKSTISFTTYFPIICEIFGKKNMEASLMNAIKDCEQRERILFFKYIYNGLVMTGISKRDALNKIADCCCKTKLSYSIILEIIVETDPLYFIDMLKIYYRYGTISTHNMVKLLQQVIDNPAPSLLTVFVEMLYKYSISDICDAATLKLLLSKAKYLTAGNNNMSERLNDIVLHNK